MCICGRCRHLVCACEQALTAAHTQVSQEEQQRRKALLSSTRGGTGSGIKATIARMKAIKAGVKPAGAESEGGGEMKEAGAGEGGGVPQVTRQSFQRPPPRGRAAATGAGMKSVASQIGARTLRMVYTHCWCVCARSHEHAHTMHGRAYTGALQIAGAVKDAATTAAASRTLTRPSHSSSELNV